MVVQDPRGGGVIFSCIDCGTMTAVGYGDFDAPTRCPPCKVAAWRTGAKPLQCGEEKGARQEAAPWPPGRSGDVGEGSA